ncbi:MULTISPECIES: PH domain-containing protein [Arthrobacter]|uniref:PH domain-containing protein n=1 Tax=unclassified Arthrobacter TaxID=235627 RepID=UPI0024B9F697|nr:PH domain-containing protein [Arthrobacter sp. H35-MC1]MDJ0317100.1 PH domain-containing protein [Arthrobacter sp. H35-MC1]
MRSWLRSREQVVIRCRPHSRILIWPITAGLLLVLVGSAALAKLQSVPFAQWAPSSAAAPWREPAIVILVVAVVLLELIFPVRRVLRWNWTRYILTNQRLLVRRGPLSRIEQIHDFEQVQEVRPVQKWRQRMVGSGDLQLYMYRGAMRTVAEVPDLKSFNEETQQAWTRVFRESIQQTPREGD